jgi:hypothetical protein
MPSTLGARTCNAVNYPGLTHHDGFAVRTHEARCVRQCKRTTIKRVDLCNIEMFDNYLLVHLQIELYPLAKND